MPKYKDLKKEKNERSYFYGVIPECRSRESVVIKKQTTATDPRTLRADKPSGMTAKAFAVLVALLRCL